MGQESTSKTSQLKDAQSLLNRASSGKWSLFSLKSVLLISLLMSIGVAPTPPDMNSEPEKKPAPGNEPKSWAELNPSIGFCFTDSRPEGHSDGPQDQCEHYNPGVNKIPTTGYWKECSDSGYSFELTCGGCHNPLQWYYTPGRESGIFPYWGDI